MQQHLTISFSIFIEIGHLIYVDWSQNSWWFSRLVVNRRYLIVIVILIDIFVP